MNAVYKELSIKEGMPTVAQAMDILKNALEQCRCDKCKCILIIHGYGSTGKGGAIHDKARQWLKAQERNGKLKAVIYGEEMDLFNFRALELKNRYRELEPLMGRFNEGVTVIEL